MIKRQSYPKVFSCGETFLMNSELKLSLTDEVNGIRATSRLRILLSLLGIKNARLIGIIYGRVYR